MALTAAALTQGKSITTVASASTASIAPALNDLVVVGVVLCFTTGAMSGDLVVTWNGITATKKTKIFTGSQRYFFEYSFIADGSAPAAVSIACSGTDTMFCSAWGVMSVRGSNIVVPWLAANDATGTIATGSFTTPNYTYTANYNQPTVGVAVVVWSTQGGGTTNTEKAGWTTVADQQTNQAGSGQVNIGMAFLVGADTTATDQVQLGGVYAPVYILGEVQAATPGVFALSKRHGDLGRAASGGGRRYKFTHSFDRGRGLWLPSSR